MQMQKHHSGSVNVFLLDHLCCIVVKAVYCSRPSKIVSRLVYSSDNVNFNSITVPFILSQHCSCLFSRYCFQKIQSFVFLLFNLCCEIRNKCQSEHSSTTRGLYCACQKFAPRFILTNRRMRLEVVYVTVCHLSLEVVSITVCQLRPEVVSSK